MKSTGILSIVSALLGFVLVLVGEYMAGSLWVIIAVLLSILCELEKILVVLKDIRLRQ